MYDSIEIKKNRLLNATAKCGDRGMAINQIEMPYTELLSLEADPSFKKALGVAEGFYTRSLNRLIAVLAKKDLYDLLTNGQVITKTTTTYSLNEEGEQVAQRKISREERGVPIGAIKLGLEMLPELIRVAEAMAGHNALEIEQLQALEAFLEGQEEGARKALHGQVEVRPLTDDVMATAQSIFLKGH